MDDTGPFASDHPSVGWKDWLRRLRGRKGEAAGAINTHTASPSGSAATAMLRSQSACVSMPCNVVPAPPVRERNGGLGFRGSP